MRVFRSKERECQPAHTPARARVWIKPWHFTRLKNISQTTTKRTPEVRTRCWSTTSTCASKSPANPPSTTVCSGKPSKENGTVGVSSDKINRESTGKTIANRQKGSNLKQHRKAKQARIHILRFFGRKKAKLPLKRNLGEAKKLVKERNTAFSQIPESLIDRKR